MRISDWSSDVCSSDLSTQRPAERLDLFGAGLVLQIQAELGNELAGHDRIRDVVDAPHSLLRVPRRADLALGIASFEQPGQLGVTALVETFVGLRQEPPCAVERVVLAAPMTEGLVLHPASALVQLLVGQLGDVERISDLANMAEAFVEDLAVGARHVQHTPTDRAIPGFGMIVEPLRRLDRRASLDALDQIRQPAGTVAVHDSAAPPTGPPLTRGAEQVMTQT